MSFPSLDRGGRALQACKVLISTALIAVVGLAVSVRTAPQPAAGAMSVEAQNAFVAANCATCHNDRAKPGGLSFAGFDAAQIEQRAETVERMIRKLRLNMMPPQTVAKRPAVEALSAFAASLEAPLDRLAAAHPNPGPRTFQRLNRAEYGRAIEDLLDLDVDVDAFLPPDTISNGFDTIADVQALTPTLLQGYLSAATKIATLAMGDRSASPTESTYKVPRTASQMVHVAGTPWGTRGGTSVMHTFPADGDYTFRMLLHSVPTGQLFGSTVRDEQIDVSVDGARVAVVTIDYQMKETDERGMNLVTPRVRVLAGAHRVSAAFVQRFDGPVDDIVAPIDFTLADTFYGSDNGITALPHLRDFSITGPFAVTGVSDTASRRKILLCRPTAASEELPCARRIVERLASQAYRQPATGAEVDALMKFYDQGRKRGDFESGIRLALQAVLVSPHFLFRLEEPPASQRSGQNYRIADLDLASRLSYFLWGAAPDADLLKVAAAGGLRNAAVLEKQVRAMLADPRSEGLSTRFAAQWLRLQDVDQIHPDALTFPAFDHALAEGFKRETELLFDSIVRDDRSVLDLLTAEYTFVNERLARHYGIPNVTGESFRRVPLGPVLDYRRGLLGQGSVLMLTSVADRTSPVMRGKWILEVLLGSPPPPPPPNIPLFDETKAIAAGGKPLSTRMRLEEHRKSPSCASCHRVIDPLGLTLENFDVVAQWRIKDNDVPVDSASTLYDGTPMTGPAGLRAALLARPEPILRTFTESLMKYALGRRVEYFDQPTIRAIVRKAAASNNRFSSFVLGIVNSSAFQMSRVDAVPTEAAHSAASPAAGPRR